MAFSFILDRLFNTPAGCALNGSNSGGNTSPLSLMELLDGKFEPAPIFWPCLQLLARWGSWSESVRINSYSASSARFRGEENNYSACISRTMLSDVDDLVGAIGYSSVADFVKGLCAKSRS